MARLGILLVLHLLAFPQAAQAQPVALERGGVEGVWLPLPEARLALAARLEVPRQRERIQLLEDQLELAQAEILLLQRAVALGQEAERALDSALESAVQATLAADTARRVAELDRDAWWRHPALWAGLGILLGGLVVGLVAGAV